VGGSPAAPPHRLRGDDHVPGGRPPLDTAAEPDEKHAAVLLQAAGKLAAAERSLREALEALG